MMYHDDGGDDNDDQKSVFWHLATCRNEELLAFDDSPTQNSNK